METNKNMLIPKTWEEFYETGLLWFINTFLHAFGWAICVDMDDDKNITYVHPARVRFRGFSEKINSQNYLKLSKYMKENSDKLYEETLEEF